MGNGITRSPSGPGQVVGDTHAAQLTGAYMPSNHSYIPSTDSYTPSSDTHAVSKSLSAGQGGFGGQTFVGGTNAESTSVWSDLLGAAETLVAQQLLSGLTQPNNRFLIYGFIVVKNNDVVGRSIEMTIKRQDGTVVASVNSGNINAGAARGYVIPAMETDLSSGSKTYQLHVTPSADNAFRYGWVDLKLAWVANTSTLSGTYTPSQHSYVPSSDSYAPSSDTHAAQLTGSGGSCQL